MIATILTDAHKHGPAYFGLPSLYLMNDNERPDTMAAPPPSQDEITTSPHASEAPLARPSTQPPAADDGAIAERARRHAFIPPRTPETFREVAAEELVTMQRQLLEGLNDLLAPEGRLTQQTSAIAALLDRNAEKINGTYEMLRGELRAFRDATQAKDADHDRQLADLRREVATLRTRMDQDRAEYERKFQEQQNCVDAVNATLAELEKKRDPAQGP